MQIVIFGSKGYMGQEFLKLYPGAATPDVDIAEREMVAQALDEHAPDVVINCAGKTGSPNVDWCEDHKMETLRSNVTGPLVLLEECAKRNIYWVHLSTGCIYTGDESTRFTEEDPPNFTGSFYSRTKGWADQILKEFPVLQLRIRMPFSDSAHPRNLITKLVKYQKVLDAPNSLTYVPDLMRAAEVLIEKRATGIYNIVNPGAISPYRVMELYKEIVDSSHEFERLSVEDLPGEVKAGRSNCVLSAEKVKNEGIVLGDAEETVQKALDHYKK